VVASEQTAGIGSRNNSWNSKKGNLFLSFAIKVEELPSDLKLESASIYFAYILKETLAAFDSKVFLKWPNDFYLNDKKIGGMITNIVDNTLVCGIGLNLVSVDSTFEKLDVSIDIEKLLENYFFNLEKKILWKQVFSKYKLEFKRNNRFFTHNNGKKIFLDSADLEDDGSLKINGERIYSRR
jgi:BirA family biotin operon repressor/biotin-[acetyl-CoA-carboxylase] ligase